MLTKEQKDKWVAALRSGEYKQTKGRLYSGKGYCCLGVFCKAVDGVNLKKGDESDDLFCDASREHYKRIRHLLGVDIRDTLMAMNDGCAMTEKRSFSQIADYIETNVQP